MNDQLPSFREALGLMKSAVPHQIFEIGVEGNVTFHGYSVDEVVMLLEAYRTHLAEMSRMAADHQSVHDAAHWSPVGPEDV
jgi:hypothetical protein